MESDLETALASAGVYHIGAPGLARTMTGVVARSEDTPPAVSVAVAQSNPGPIGETDALVDTV